MSVIGLDLGSHWASFAVYQEKSGSCEVFADDLGARAVPCAVAFRGEEVIIGQAALSQQYKNSPNTFDDIRSLLEKEEESVHVPGIGKDVAIGTLASHFFRHVHDQVKQQVGHAVRDTIVSLPEYLMTNEKFKERVITSAQAGGIRVKAFLPDTTAALLAHNFDAPNDNKGSNCSVAKVVVLDLGWTLSEAALFDVYGGIISPVRTKTTFDCKGANIVEALAKHCSKDFKRKSKVSCEDSQRSVLRLKKEAEIGARILSTTQETMIDIDALFEGMDYSSKVSRARFEDLTCLYFMGVKQLVSSLEIDLNSVTHVVLSGGFSAVPKVLSTVKDLFPSAKLMRGRIDPGEAVCLGAAIHGMTLSKEGVLDNAPAGPESLPTLPVSLSINGQVVFQKGLVLPLATVVPVTAPTSEDSGFSVGFDDQSVAQVSIPSSRIVSTNATTELNISVAVSAEGAIDLVVEEVNSSDKIAELHVPAPGA